ncbi:MAG: hypothetical protein MJ135_02475, partial [Oscillospiraceae bacterium]|nr:hypothetical protein [Oscillospiraceae bacterium]
FENKIKEEEKKIIEIKKIQRSYRSEVIEMKNKIRELQELLEETKKTYDSNDEFGLCRGKYELTINKVNNFLEEIGRINDYSKFEYIERSEDEDESYLEDCLSKYEIILKQQGWVHFKEVYSEIPTLSKEYGYLILLRIKKDKGDKTSYAGAVIGMMLEKLPNHPALGCTVVDTNDDENHFWLVRYKD